MSGPLTKVANAKNSPSIAGAMGDPQFLRDMAGGIRDALNRGIVGTTLGGPVDLANSILNLGKAGVGYAGHKMGLLTPDQMPVVNDNPTGGSEWWGKQMQDLGMVSGNRNPLAEGLAGAAAPLAFAGAPKLANALHKGLPVVRDAMEHGLSYSGVYPEMVPPRRFRGPALEGIPTGGNVTVDGRPYNFGTDKRLTDIAKSYAQGAGVEYTPLSKYAPVDKTRAGNIAAAYDEMPHDPGNPDVSRAYSAMMDETKAQYDHLVKNGYKFDFIKGDDPYGNPRNAIIDLIKNKRMSVFPTKEGFGGSESAGIDISGNPLTRELPEYSMDPSGKIPTTYNDLFRAVHDAYGHGQYGVGFRAGGEENAFQAHSRMYSPEAIPAATSETRGQNSWVNYGPKGAFNQTASPGDTQYAPQKTGVMPEWTWKAGVGE